MKIRMLFLLIATSIRSFSQTAEEDYVIGTWKVVSSDFFYTEVPSYDYYKIDKLQKLSLTAIFEFKPNHLFNLRVKNRVMEIHNAHWKYNPIHDSYIVQDWEDRLTNKNVIIELHVSRSSKFKYWLVKEPSPGRLTVKKA